MARLIVIQGGREKSFDLIDDVVFVGSDEGCSIRVGGEGVQPRHAQILKVDGAWRLVHLGAGTTTVNGRPAAQHELSNGDVVNVGAATLTFRGGVRPAAPAAPEEEAAAAPAAPGRSGGGATRRRPRRGAARRPGKQVSVDARTRKSAGQREILTRKNVRKSGMTGPQTAAIAAGISLVAVVAIWFLVKGMPAGGLGDTMARAKTLRANTKLAEAIAELETIPEGAANYPAARRMIEDIKKQMAQAPKTEMLQWGVTEYENNIKYFVETKILNPKYADSRTGQIRVLVARCRNFLEQAPGHRFEPEVKSLLAKYEPEIAGKPVTWIDTFVMADTERGRAFYGPAHELVADWLAKNRATGDEYEVGQADRLLKKIERGANQWWDDQQERARQNVREGKYNDAYSKYMTAVRRFEGWPEKLAEAEKHIADLKAGVGTLLTEN